jgi:hypothetical protein
MAGNLSGFQLRRMTGTCGPQQAYVQKSSRGTALIKEDLSGRIVISFLLNL